MKKAKRSRLGDGAVVPLVSTANALPVGSQAAATGADAAFLPVSAEAPAVGTGGDVAFLPVSPGVAQFSAVSEVVIAAADAAAVAVPEKADAGTTSKASRGRKQSNKQDPKIEDTASNRTAVAEQHGFPWQPDVGEMRYSVQEACQAQKPSPKRLQLERYLEAILGERPKKV